MTKLELIKDIELYKKDLISYEAMSAAVDAYSSASNGSKPVVSGSLPHDVLFEKLQSMRLTKKQVNKMGVEAYGYTECINDLLIWLKSLRQ